MKQTITICLLLLLACQTRKEQNKTGAEFVVRMDSIKQVQQDSIRTVSLKQKKQELFDSLAAIVKAKPVWGGRMKVAGDFDGDGIQDTLYEKYISQVTGKETNKSYEFEALGEGSDYLFYWQEWIAEKKVLLKLESKKKEIRSFVVDKNGLHDGFLYLKNVGDLNKDSTDEIVYILNYIDFSNSSSAQLVTYKNGEWNRLHHWIITEHDFWGMEGQQKSSPNYIKKKNGQVYYKEMDGDYGGYIWKLLKINW